ncbi:hypothetical protein GIB67_002615 [Kingdonia uniflora]|uniref:Uncharacterized protein n=1 Tax=Kingdonia uniflora TaxID=39325 RepID=A0A7J7N4H4_9MAGN|nr:hypothetical protein GIB67_002615 [Kingdonia uniflora]
MAFSIRPHFRNLFIGSSRFIFSDTRCYFVKGKNYLTHLDANANQMDLFETNTSLKELVKDGYLKDARKLFDRMPQRDEVSWTIVMSGYVKGSDAREALRLFSYLWVDATIRIDPFVLALVLKACGCNSKLTYGRLIHGYSVKTGFINSVFVGSALLDMYTKCGCVSMGCRVFNEMQERNVVSWTAIITGLVHAGYNREGLMYFSEMWESDVQCDAYTFASALKACADCSALHYGRAIHTQTMKAGLDSSSFVANTLAIMYNKCGNLEYGLRMFQRMKNPDVVSWTTVVATYVQQGREERAIEMFFLMRESGVYPNEYTFAAVFSGCAALSKVKWGEQLHAYVLCIGFVDFTSVANAIMTMYSKCGSLDSAVLVFDKMVKRDLVSWSTIIAGYAQNGNSEEAFEFFSNMRWEGQKTNEYTLASLVSACGNMAILEQGKQLHAHIFSIGLEDDVTIKSALINMYSKCGSIDKASRIFDPARDDNVVSWTAMINGYAEHGHSREAIDLFEKMCAAGLRPDDVTFIGVLIACSHGGLVDLGFNYFNSMSSCYNINPSKEHYGCMVDLLCRAGRLNDAEQMIHNMPFNQDDVVWSTLLRACRIHGDTERGKRAAEYMLQLDPNCAVTHITLSNIYSTTGRWRDAADVRGLMRSKGVIKEPGWSWVKVKDHVSAFIARDRSHPQSEDIYSMLELLASKTEMTDHSQDSDSLLHGF